MDLARRARGDHGLADLRGRRHARLLAGLALPDGLLRQLGTHHGVPDAAGPCAPRAAHARRPHRREGDAATHHHDHRVARLHRRPGRPCPRPPLPLVRGAARCRARRQHPLRHRLLFHLPGLWAAPASGNNLLYIGYCFIFLVYRENTFTSATIEVVAEQRVITTGPYAIVRHPMYASGSLYLAGTPLALASYWGLLAVAFMVPALIWRLLDEERLLAARLP